MDDVKCSKLEALEHMKEKPILDKNHRRNHYLCCFHAWPRFAVWALQRQNFHMYVVTYHGQNLGSQEVRDLQIIDLLRLSELFADQLHHIRWGAWNIKRDVSALFPTMGTHKLRFPTEKCIVFVAALTWTNQRCWSLHGDCQPLCCYCHFHSRQWPQKAFHALENGLTQFARILLLGGFIVARFCFKRCCILWVVLNIILFCAMVNYKMLRNTFQTFPTEEWKQSFISFLVDLGYRICLIWLLLWRICYIPWIYPVFHV